MKKLLSSLLALAGMSSSTNVAPQNSQLLDPNSILFSIPTISNDLAPLEKLEGDLQRRDLAFHEDEWSQVEFFRRDQLNEVQRLLKEYKAFEAANRVQTGWRRAYVRTIDRVAVIQGPRPVSLLQQVLGVKAEPGPVLLSSGSVAGRVKRGFSFPLGGNVTLYGYEADSGIPVLGAFIGESPDDSKLIEAFARLNAEQGVVLVDWRQQLVLVSIDANGRVQTWQP